MLCTAVLALMALPSEAQQVRLPSGKGQSAELSSDGPQTRKGDVFAADKNVDLQYAGMRLRADHIEYNEKTHDSLAQGYVQFDFETSTSRRTKRTITFRAERGRSRTCAEA